MRALAALPVRSLIPACDVSFERFQDIVSATGDIPEVGAYKIGAALALAEGLPRIVAAARSASEKPLIYDHQKAGTDIPDTGAEFMRVLADSGIDAVILFPFAGPTSERAWIQAASDVDLDVIVGAHMTHANFVDHDNGFISVDSIQRMYLLAASCGVRHFVVPGNNRAAIERIRGYISDEISDPVFYAPGFIAQGGEISEAARAAGERWHAIIGRAIYDAPDLRVAVDNLSRHLK